MADLGRIPARIDVHVQRGYPFRASMTMQDGSAFPAVELRFSGGVVWAATVAGDTASWDVPAVLVDARAREEHVTLVSSGDVVWAKGRLVEDSVSGFGGSSTVLVAPGSGSQVLVAPALPGPPGPSNYDVWLAAGNVGTEAEFLEAYRGPQGVPGGSDAATAAWIEEGPLTSELLNTSYVRGGGESGLVLDVLAGSDGAAGDGIVDDTSAVQAKIANAATWGGVVLLGKHFVTGSVTVPDGVTIRGRNDDSGLILPAGANFPGLLFDGSSSGRAESLRVTALGATASGASAIKVRGPAADITVNGVRAEGLFDGFVVEGSEGTPGVAERITLDNCHAENSGQYGFRFGDVDGADLIGCRSVVSELDGIKLRKNVRNWVVTGGSFTGATGGDGLDAYAGGGDFTINGAIFSGNTLNGIVIKCDDLSASDPVGYGRVRNGIVANVHASGNGGSGLTVHRNNGDVDDITEPLVQSITVSGVFTDNGNYGVFVNARQVSLLGVHAKRNGLDGIRVQAAARDVDLVACHAAGNSRTVPNSRDGIWIAGQRVKVWGGSSNGADPDGATNDADVAAATKTQRYGIRLESTAARCFVGGVSLLNNVTADRSDQTADTVWFNNPSDSTSSPVLIMPNNQRIFGRKADGTQVSVAYITTGGGLNVGDTTAGLSFLGASATFFTRVDTPASTATRASTRIPHGDPPTSPANGDMWTTTAGLFVRINGATVGPLS